MSDPTFRELLRTKTRQIAHAILMTHGLPALQARTVATAADCSVGTLYNVWRNLDGLIIAANAVTLANLGQALIAACDAAPSDTRPDGELRDGSAGAGLEPRLLALADAYVAFAVDNQPAWRALFEHRLPQGQYVPDWYREAQAELFAIVESVLEPFVGEPGERKRAARALFGSVHGIVALALDEKLGAFERADCEDQVRFIVAAAARGLARRS